MVVRHWHGVVLRLVECLLEMSRRCRDCACCQNSYEIPGAYKSYGLSGITLLKYL